MVTGRLYELSTSLVNFQTKKLWGMLNVGKLLELELSMMRVEQNVIPIVFREFQMFI